jgi:transcriptional regulator with XRE-family HTH domain
MATAYRRRLAAAAGRPPSEELAAQEFARRLEDLLRERGMRKSDLARAMWGDTLDKVTGRPVAKHRDRISEWTNGKSLPEPRNLELLAQTLGVPVEHLAEPLIAQAVDRERSSLQIVQAAGHPDKVHLKVDKLVTSKIASQVMALLVADD